MRIDEEDIANFSFQVYRPHIKGFSILASSYLLGVVGLLSARPHRTRRTRRTRRYGAVQHYIKIHMLAKLENSVHLRCHTAICEDFSSCLSIIIGPVCYYVCTYIDITGIQT